MPYTGRSHTTQPTLGRAPLLRAAAALLALAFGFGATGHARAQQAISSATLGGRVEDANGAAVGGAAVVTIRPEDVALLNRRLDQTAYRGPRVETGVVPAGYDVTDFFARVDHRLSEATNLAARYSLYDLAAVNSRTAGGLNAASRGTGLDSRDQTYAASAATALGTRALNEARLQLTRSRLAAPVNDAHGPAVNISGVAGFGTATFSPTARDLDVFEIADNVSYQRGAHSTKAGADFLLNRVEINFPGAAQGVYAFTSRAAFLAGNYGSFQQAFGEAGQFQSNPNLGLFAQDEWRPRPDLTVNAGLRYDAQHLPGPVRTDADNCAPRLGAAFAPGDRRTVVRAGFGLYFDRVPLRAVSNALQRDGSKYVVVQFGPGDPGAPTFPNALPSLPSSPTTRPNVTRSRSVPPSSSSSRPSTSSTARTCNCRTTSTARAPRLSPRSGVRLPPPTRARYSSACDSTSEGRAGVESGGDASDSAPTRSRRCARLCASSSSAGPGRAA